MMYFNGTTSRRLLQRPRVLIMDEDSHLRQRLADCLHQHGYEPLVLDSPLELNPDLKKSPPDIALIGSRACGHCGLEIMEKLKELCPRLICIFMAEEGVGRVKALQRGAYDHLPRSMDPEELLATLRRGLEKVDLEREKAQIERELLEKNQALEDLNQRLRLTFQSMKTLAACTYFDQLSRTLLKEFAYNMAAQGGSIYFRIGEQLELIQSIDPGHAHCSIPLPLREGSVFDEAVRSRKVVCINDIRQRQDIKPSGWMGYKDGSLIIFPFFDEKDELLSIISLHNRVSPPFTDQDLEIGHLLTSFGNETLRAMMANETLRKREREYRHLFENLPDVFYRADLKGNLIMVSPSVLKIFGYPPEEMIGRNIFQNFFPEPVEPEALFTLLQNKGALDDYELVLKHKTGRPVWISTNTHFSRDEAGAVIGVEGILRDVTDQKKAEAERMRLATAVEQATEVIYITDTDGVVQYVNPSFERVTGFRREEVIGKKPNILKSGKHPILFYKTLWKTIRNGEVWQGQFVNRRKDGTLFEEEATITPIRDREGRITNYVAVKRDISREAVLLDQLLQSQKMEAIGSLAGGIAHDFNNILSAIIGNAELAKLESPGKNQLQEYVNRILKASLRAKDLVNRILAFSRRSEKELKPTNVSSHVRETLNLLRATLPATIEIRRDIQIDPAYVMADATQIHQVIMNICTNAGQAMQQKGGILTVTVGIAEESNDFSLRFSGKKAANYLKLSIRDSGHGMSPEILGRIFDPYFTTKEKGSGTGLGLTMALSIVQNYGGHIALQSRQGEGSNFDVYLPMCDMEAEETPTPDDLTLPRGRERILLVDDEEEIVHMFRQILEFLGYEVKAFYGGREALECIRNEKQRFDMVITDLTMPKMTGDMLAQEIKKVQPDLPVILFTGFSEKISELQAKKSGIDAFIMKPVSMHDLARAVRQVLDKKDPLRSITG